MIGKLRGLVDSIREDFVILDVAGVGYEVHCSTATLAGLPRVGETATLAVETYVREDAIRLFGFGTELEREWFRLLNTVQGVGTRVALGVLSTMRPGELATAIALKDVAGIARAPGVGKRLAERIAIELKEKAPAYADSEPAALRAAGGADAGLRPKPVADAVSALVNLGYPPLQAGTAVAAASRAAGDGATTEQLIRLGLKEMAR